MLATAIKPSAQINIICPKLVDSTLNYFYIGIDNPVEVIGIKMTPDHTITISGEGTTIFSGKESKYTPGNYISEAGGNRYMIQTYTPSDSCWIRIYKGKKEIFKKRFISGPLPEPRYPLAVWALHDKTVSRDTLLHYPFLDPCPPNFYLKECYQITSFEATFETDSSGTFLTTNVTGNYLTQEQIQIIKTMDKGAYITFENIRATGPDNRKRKLAPFWIKLK